jgi:hypothetical protein
MTASLRRVGGGSLPQRWGKWRQEGSFGQRFPFYSRKRERESVPGPARHRSDGRGLVGPAGTRRRAAPQSRSDSHPARSV